MDSSYEYTWSNRETQQTPFPTDNHSAFIASFANKTVHVNITVSVAFGTTALLTIILNCFTITFFCTQNSVWQPGSWFHCAIAFSDLIKGLTSLPILSLLSGLGRLPFGYVLCFVCDFFRIVIDQSAMLLIIVASVDRFSSLTMDYSSYLRSRRKSRLFLWIGFAWLIPGVGNFISGAVWLLLVPYEERISDYNPLCLDVPESVDTTFSIVGITLHVYIPFTLLFVLQIMTFHKIRHRLRARRKIGCGIALRRVNATTPQAAAKHTLLNDNYDKACRRLHSKTETTMQAAIPGTCGTASDMKIISRDKTSCLNLECERTNASKECDRRKTEIAKPCQCTIANKTQSHSQIKRNEAKDGTLEKDVVTRRNTCDEGNSKDLQRSDSLKDVVRKKENIRTMASFVTAGISGKHRPTTTVTERKRKKLLLSISESDRIRYVKPLVHLSTVVLMLGVSALPLALYYTYVHVRCRECFNLDMYMWLKVLCYSYSSTKPCIFIIFNKKFRNFLRKCFSRICF